MRDALESYGWLEVRRDLEKGVDPKTVASRLGEPVSYLIEVAHQQGWPIVWNGPSHAHERAEG